MRPTLSFVHFALGALLLAAPLPGATAAAQTTPAQALKLAKAGTQAALAEHKARTAAALAELEPALDALVAGLQADQLGAPLLQTFLDAAHAFQLEVGDATEEADEAIATAFSEALAALAAAKGSVLAGDYPPGFTSGDGGAFDDALRLLGKAVVKFHAKLEKRAGKAIAKAAAAGVGLTLQFVPPVRRGFFGPTETDPAGSFHNPPRVHFVAAASRLDVEHDGLVALAGTAIPTEDTHVQLVSPDPRGGTLVVTAVTTAVVFSGLGGEWSVLVDDEGALLLETNYVLDVFFDGDKTSADASVGVP